MNESPACDVRNGGGENVEREQENEEKFVKSGLMCGWVGWLITFNLISINKTHAKKYESYISYYFLECVKNVGKYCKKENKLFFF